MRTVIAVGLALWATGASAEYAFLGQGGFSCGRWQQGRRTKEPTSFTAQAWVLGYLTRANYSGDTSLTAGTDADGVFAWIDNFCRANPLKDIADAAEYLVAELQVQARKAKAAR